MDNDVYFGGWERQEQGKFFLVAAFFYRIRFCEARSNTRSDTAHLPQVSFLTFSTWETDAQKDEVIYRVTNLLGHEQRLGSVFSSLLFQGSCHLEQWWEEDFYENNKSLVNFLRSLYNANISKQSLWKTYMEEEELNIPSEKKGGEGEETYFTCNILLIV